MTAESGDRVANPRACAPLAANPLEAPRACKARCSAGAGRSLPERKPAIGLTHVAPLSWLRGLTLGMCAGNRGETDDLGLTGCSAVYCAPL